MWQWCSGAVAYVVLAAASFPPDTASTCYIVRGVIHETKPVARAHGSIVSGYRLTTGDLVPDEDVSPSPDDKTWLCVNTDGRRTGFFVPGAPG